MNNCSHIRYGIVDAGAILCRSPEGNLAAMLDLLGQLVPERPDWVILPEAFTAKGVRDGTASSLAETLDGRTVQAMRAFAGEHRVGILCPLYRRSGNDCFNSAVQIGPEGDILAIYDKRFLAPSNPAMTCFEEGALPGQSSGILEAESTRVGLLICSEIMDSNNWSLLAGAGARHLWWPSAYSGGRRLQALAILSGCYVISSVRSGGARVIDPGGRVIEETTMTRRFAVVGVPREFIVASFDFQENFSELAIKSFGEKISVQSYPDDRLWLVQSLDDSVTRQTLADLTTAGELHDYQERIRFQLATRKVH